MKKLLLFAAISLYALTSFAQVSVSSGNPNLDVKVKRSFAFGSDVAIDLIVTSNTDWETICFGVIMGSKIGVIIYDDEGNMYDNEFEVRKYNGSRIWFESDGEQSYEARIVRVSRNIQRKVRMIIKDVDEYASSFSQITIGYCGNNNSKYAGKIIIKNLPIARN